ncbi:hypothetical protein OAG53_00440 [Akkermansiaceae bacterium]|nr:hypothetical protein [Akkermansiaceae bacterium]
MNAPPFLTSGFLATILLSSCAKEGTSEEEPLPTPAPFAPLTVEPEAMIENPPVQNVGFADPDTTAKLISKEETKTYVGETPKAPATPKADNVIKISPPPLPTAELPDAPSN